MSFVEREAFITVPVELLKYNKGFGMDCGSSGVKFVYLTKEDKEKENSSISETAKMRTITFQRSELVEGLRFVKQRADLFQEKIEDSEVLFLTGIGCIQKISAMTEIFNMRQAMCSPIQTNSDVMTSTHMAGKGIGKFTTREGFGRSADRSEIELISGIDYLKSFDRYKIISEVDSIATAFSYMACNVGRRHLLESRNEQAVADALTYCIGLAKIIAIMKNDVENEQKSSDEQQFISTFYQNTGYDLAAVNDVDDVPLVKTEPGMFPCLLITCGSYTSSVKLTAPGVYSYGDGTTSGGRMLLGIANKLIGCKTYDDLINLATKGDSSAVHQSTYEIIRADKLHKEENVYTATEREMETNALELFSCGKLVGANCDDFRPEDIASAWLDHFVQDYVRAVLLNCYVNGIKRVFLCGGALSHPYVRRLVAKEMIKKNVGYNLVSQVPPVVFDFINFPQQLCALGCMAFDHQSRAKQECASGQTTA